MALDPRFIGAFTNAFFDLIGANIADAITDGTGGIVNLRSWAQSLRDDASNAVNQAAGATSTADSALNTAQQAQSTADSKPSYSDIPTNIPLWVNINANDDVTFPLSQLVMWTRDTSDATGGETLDPYYAPTTDVLELGFIRATRNRTYSTIGMITGTGGWGNSPSSVHVYLYKMNTITGALTQLWDSGEVKDSISAAGTQFRLTMPTVTAQQGDIFAVGVWQHAPTIGTAVRPLACLRQSKPTQPAGVYPRNIYGYYNATSTPPASISAGQINVGNYIPWFLLG